VWDGYSLTLFFVQFLPVLSVGSLLIFAAMQFKDVIGQASVKQNLVELVHHNRLSHALLLLGREGSGGLSLALAFAQYVVCEKVNNRSAGKSTAGPSLFGEEPVPAPVNQARLTDSCGTCPACVKAQQLVHPDIHFSYPVVTKKPGTPPISTDYITEWRDFVRDSPYGNVYDWLQFIGAENKQGNITANECNDIIRKLNLKSFESEYKILVLWMPEYLGNEGNKLLKLIEEPPLNTLFILVAENESLILPTIVSRCQLIRVPGLETRDIEAALLERGKMPELTARQAASVSEGNYREALQIVQNAEEDWQSLLREWLNAILKTGPIAQTKWVEEISRLGREKQKQFLRYFNHLLEQAVRVRILGSENIPEKERDFADRLNKIAGIEQQQAIIEELDRATYYIERNANAKILFHALTIKLYHIIRDKIVFLTD
jgi:DNA polymerase-3 subunit delta'